MSAGFFARRRQVFIQPSYYVAHEVMLRSERDYWQTALQAVGDDEAHQRSLALQTHSRYAFEHLALNYTAGEPIEPLRAEFGEVIAAYERYQKALGIYEDAPMMSPLGMDQLGDYERCMQMLGLCYLLHRRDLVPRLAAMIDPGYRGEDTLYEDLMSYVEVGRVDLDEWYHGEPYTPLIQAMYAEDKTQASSLLNQYVENWYPNFKYVPWHDGHLRVDGTDGDYFGYWAFEAGAVALLCDIDDSAITHLVYPKDLVAWARAHKALSGDSSEGVVEHRLRCEAGQPCPQEGWWLTPAKIRSRRLFKAGEVMPSVSGDYGVTIWQWDDRQD